MRFLDSLSSPLLSLERNVKLVVSNSIHRPEFAATLQEELVLCRL